MSDNPNAARDAAIQSWLGAKEIAAAAVENERALRAQVVAMLFPEPVEGTNTYDLGMGYKVKLSYGFDYSLCKEKGKRISHEEHVERVETLLSEIEVMGNEAPALAQRLVKWKPELSVSEYKKLDIDFPIQAQIKAALDKAIVTSPTSPQLSFEAPK